MSALHSQTITYDFNSQWNGDWDTYHVQTGGNAASPSMNYSKASEGRTGGAGGNILAGTVSGVGYQGSISSIYDGYGAVDLSKSGDRVRLQGSYSAFANESAFASGSSEVGQVGLISAPSFSNAADSILKLGDSVYVGFVENSWSGQTPTGPGTANVEVGLFQDGSMTQSFGSYNLSGYGGRIGSQVWAQFFEYDIVFENLPDGTLGYKVGLNTVSFYDDNLFSSPDPTEGSAVNLGTWEGSLAGVGGLSALDDLYVSYGAYVASDGNATITGYTFDHSPSGDLHDGIIAIPEPSAVVLGFSSLLILVRRRR
ncbi:MAG: hypothetical protein ACSHYB_12700 [Roseibacillus sp.]